MIIVLLEQVLRSLARVCGLKHCSTGAIARSCIAGSRPQSGSVLHHTHMVIIWSPVTLPKLPKCIIYVPLAVGYCQTRTKIVNERWSEIQRW